MFQEFLDWLSDAKINLFLGGEEGCNYSCFQVTDKNNSY